MCHGEEGMQCVMRLRCSHWIHSQERESRQEVGLGCWPALHWPTSSSKPSPSRGSTTSKTATPAGGQGSHMWVHSEPFKLKAQPWLWPWAHRGSVCSESQPFTGPAWPKLEADFTDFKSDVAFGWPPRNLGVRQSWENEGPLHPQRFHVSAQLCIYIWKATGFMAWSMVFIKHNKRFHYNMQAELRSNDFPPGSQTGGHTLSN